MIVHYGEKDPYPFKEQELQHSCVRYLAMHKKKPLFFHPPNGGFRSKVEAAIFKGLGVRPGVADLVVMEPRSSFHGLVIELKVKGGKLSDYQKTFLEDAEARGYYACVVWSLGGFIDVVDGYLNEPIF